MVNAAKYSAVEKLQDGSRVNIRALKQEDRTEFLIAVGRISAGSLYRRFFGVRRGFSEKEVAYFLNIDFVDHVALVAEQEEANRSVIVGGARYIVMKPGKAEVAFVVIDEYQGQGIGTALLRHLAEIARDAGLRELVAEVLPGNEAMLKVFEKSGLPLITKSESDVVEVSLNLEPTRRHPPSGL